MRLRNLHSYREGGRLGLMRLAVLTSGGDCPGLNAVIRAVVRTASNEFGDTVVGYEDGWVGLMEDRRRDLYDDAEIDRILLRGGTILGTGRLHPDKFKAGLDTIKANMADAEVDALIAIGGEGTSRVPSGFLTTEFQLWACRRPLTMTSTQRTTPSASILRCL